MAAITKNQAGQGVPIFAQDVSALEGRTDYEPYIIVYISRDGEVAVESDATSSGTGYITEIGGGFYWCPLTQSEANGDILTIFCDRTGTGDVAFDRLVLGTEEATGTATLNTVAIADAIWDEMKSGHTIAGSFGEFFQDPITVYLSGILSDVAVILAHLVDIKGTGWTSTDTLANVANLSDINAEMDQALADSGIGTDVDNAITHLTDIKGAGWSSFDTLANVADLSDINVEVDQALIDIGLHKLTSEAIGTGTIADGSIISQLADSGGSAVWADYDNTVHSLKAIKASVEEVLAESGTGGGATAAEIWRFTPRTLTQTGEELYSVLMGTEVIMQRGDNLSLTFTGLGNLSLRSKLWFTVKRQLPDAEDSDALIQITEATEADGLLYINGTASDNSANGSITVYHEANGDITISLTSVETAKLPTGSTFLYDVQMLDTSGNVTTLVSGGCQVVRDITRSTS